MVKRIQMRNSAPHPVSRKTPRGGRMMARMILMMSLFDDEMSVRFSKLACDDAWRCRKHAEVSANVYITGELLTFR